MFDLLSTFRLRQLRNRLPLPDALEALIQSGRWVHPGHDVMRAKIPFIRDPLEFLPTKDAMVRTGPLMSPNENENESLSEYRGRKVRERELPWIDVEKTLFIIINERAGDDVGIALDYRPGIYQPRIVGGDWHSGSGCVYREIAPSFEAFASLLGL